MLGVRESWVLSWHSVFAGLFLTNFLPGTLGSDGLQVVLLTKTCGRASTALGAVAYPTSMAKFRCWLQKNPCSKTQRKSLRALNLHRYLRFMVAVWPRISANPCNFPAE